MKTTRTIRLFMYGVLVTLAGAIAPQAWAKGGLNCTVVDENDKPVAKQEVTLTSAGGKENKKTTNADGVVKFGGLDDGTYTMTANGYVGTKPIEVSGNGEKSCKSTLLSAAFASGKVQEPLQLVQQRKFAEAEESGKKVVEMMPGQASAHYVLAVAYAYNGNENAADEIKKAAELDPQKYKDKIVPIQMQTLNVQAESAKQKNDFTGALKKYEAALTLAPNDPTVFYNMAVTYAAAKDYVQALKNIDFVLAVKPDDQEAKLRKAAWEKLLDEQLSNPLKK